MTTRNSHPPLSASLLVLFTTVIADYAQNEVMVGTANGEPGAVVIHAVYSGDHADADKALAPLAQFGKPVANTIGPIDYVALQRSWDNSDPRHGGDYLKSGFVTDISDAQINTIVDGFEADPERATTFFYGHSGGAINRVAENATAFPNRNAISSPFVSVSWNKGADPDRHIQYMRSYWSTIEAYTDGFYTNIGDYETQASVNKNYRGNYKRLVELKDRYDPGNLFRLNANVQPSTGNS